MAREHDRYMTGLWVAQEARKREGWTTDCAKTAAAVDTTSGGVGCRHAAGSAPRGEESQQYVASSTPAGVAPGPLTHQRTKADGETVTGLPARRLQLAVAEASSPPSKYGNVKTGKYASKKEATRALALALMQEAGQILNLREQVPYVLIPRQLGPDGKVEERAVGYVADFVFDEWTADGWRQVTEDCKGFRTPDYIIKRKLMRFTFGIVVRET